MAGSGRGDFVWLDGTFIPQEQANVSVFTHGLHYASSVFEGERSYGGVIFKSSEHSQRLHRSAQILDFEIPFAVDVLDKAKAELVKRNGDSDTYIRCVAFRGDEALGVSAQNNTIHVALTTLKWGSYFDAAQKLKGLRLDMADYRRPDPKTAPSEAKAAGLYMICTISKHKAERKGYADALMLDWQGRVAECTGANVFFVKDGEIHTPIADCFLDGITRKTVLELAKQRNIPVHIRRIMPDELPSFEQCFLTGSAAEVSPVSEIGPYHFVVGDIATTLMDDYSNLVRGNSHLNKTSAA